MVPPIRVAIIGLSANAITDWASRAHLPYFLSSVGRSKYQIVALCNSSKASAERSIKMFGLAPGTRAYGSPGDLAADPDVQLVVCCTRADKHYETTLPSIKAGKDVLIEWPLAQNAAKAEELTAAAKESGSRTIVGLQVRYAPGTSTSPYGSKLTGFKRGGSKYLSALNAILGLLGKKESLCSSLISYFFSGMAVTDTSCFSVPTTLKLKELIACGRIGKVWSSEFTAARWTSDQYSVSSALSYFADRKVGGNFVTIGFGHGKSMGHGGYLLWPF